MLALTHPVPAGDAQAAVFAHAVGRRKGTVTTISERLPVLRTRRALYRIPAARRPGLMERRDVLDALARAAMPWRTVRRWLLGAMTGPAWAAVLPSMSYQDRLEHLPEFDRLDVRAEGLAAELADPARVLWSGVTPLEIVAALRQVPGSRWTPALRRAADLSVANVPALPGRTLVLVDRTASMADPAWPGSPLTRGDAAAAFGAAVASRAASADLVQCGTVTARVPVGPGEPLTTVLARFGPLDGTTGPAAAVRHLAAGHDRVIILTHPSTAAQAAEAVTIPGHEHVVTSPVPGWFRAIPYIEAARTAAWPFVTQ
ncbi:hypothetical protein [Sphaerisporangium aureirubrum]|uniref:TROVE domain-containing protein n=1 Tax=Sphaerisporangium aureirubrum TaxID=1544736 RepID=A0ABW1NAR8_9ACTN